MTVNDYIPTRVQAVRDAIHDGTRVRIAVITGISQADSSAWTTQLDSWLKERNASSDVVVYGSAGDAVSSYAAYLTTALAQTPKPDLVVVTAGIRDHIAQTTLSTYHAAIASLASTCNAQSPSVPMAFMFDNDYPNAGSGTNTMLDYLESWVSYGTAKPYGTNNAFDANYYIIEDGFMHMRHEPTGDYLYNPVSDIRSSESLATLISGDNITPNAAGHDLLFAGVSQYLSARDIIHDHVTNPVATLPVGATTGEHAICIDSGGTAHMYTALWETQGIKHWTSTDADYSTWTNQGIVISSWGTYSVFEPYVQRISDSEWYMVVKSGYEPTQHVGYFYMYRSTNGTTWTRMNNGSPVLTLGDAQTNPLQKSAWNPAIWVDTTAKRIHLMYDGVESVTGGDYGLSYSYVDYTGTLSTTTPIDFSTHAPTTSTIPGAVWPAIQYVEGKGWLVTAGFWGGNVLSSGVPEAGGSYVTHYWAHSSDDLTDPASWRRGWATRIKCEGVIVADPNYLVSMPTGKNAKTLVSFSYGQTASSTGGSQVYLTYSDYTIEQIFDMLVGLTATANGAQIDLAWTDAITGEDGWYVERRVAG